MQRNVYLGLNLFMCSDVTELWLLEFKSNTNERWDQINPLKDWQDGEPQCDYQNTHFYVHKTYKTLANLNQKIQT